MSFVPFPEEFAQRYREAGIWQDETLGQLLRESARRWPDKPAVGSRTYRELDECADSLAAGFRAQGLQRGDRVLLQLPNVGEFVEVLFGLLRAGVVPVLCLPAHRAAELTHLAATAGAVGYICADRVGDCDYRELARTVQAQVPAVRTVVVLGDAAEFTSLAEVAPRSEVAVRDAESEISRPKCDFDEGDAADVAVLLISGGTTGLPKLIPRTHRDYAYNARASAGVCALTSDDTYLVTLPAAHNFPLACPGILGTLATGGRVVLTTDPSPETAFAVIEREKVTVTALVPPLAQLWSAAVDWEESDISSLRLLQVGGARLPEASAREVLAQLDVTLQQVFGMAEGLLNYTRLDDDVDVVCRTQGRPLSELDEVRVVDADGRDLAAGEEGELLTRGPYTIRGYYNAPEHNARAFTSDGFYRSGDLVRQLPSGHLIVTGRIKDVVNRGGENVSCDELEAHLVAHPMIRHAGVVGLPDDALGERVCAALVCVATPPTPAELRAYLLGRGLAPFKVPDVIVTVDKLPLTAVGKIDKRALAAAVQR